jgi:ketosteroid isomerase-like protein
MSRKNVELVEGLYDAFNRGDIEGILAPMREDVELVEDSTIRPDAGTYRGLAAIRKFFQQLFDFPTRVEGRPELAAQPEEFIEHEDKVIVPVRVHGRARFTGIEIEFSLVHVWTLERDKVTQHHIYPNKDRALEAIGLREPDSHRNGSA